MSKYDTIGVGYNSTRMADVELTNNLLRHLDPEVDGRYLDIGCGTGNYTIELANRGYNMTGMDPSRRMLEEARARSNKVQWRMGSAEATGLDLSSFDGIIATLTIHHWSNLEKGFKELKSVLKTNGKMVIFTSTPQQMEKYWLNHYFPKMLKDSMQQMPDLKVVELAMKKAGFKIVDVEKYFVKPDLQDKFLYCGKHAPESYFNDDIRNGISSFSSLANRKEVTAGLLQLKNDVDTGEVFDIINRYDSSQGDYLYITAS